MYVDTSEELGSTKGAMRTEGRNPSQLEEGVIGENVFDSLPGTRMLTRLAIKRVAWKFPSSPIYSQAEFGWLGPHCSIDRD